MLVLKTLIVLWFFILGLFIGGFFNVYLYRIPREISLFVPSTCPFCHSSIYLRHIIPVWGRMILGWKCRVCQAVIDVRYTIIEVVCSALFGCACLITIFFADERIALEAGIGRALWFGYTVLYFWSLVVIAKSSIRIPKGIFLVGGLVMATIFFPPCYFLVDFLVENPQNSIDDEFYGTVIFSSIYTILTILALSHALLCWK